MPRHGKAGNLNHALRTMYPRGKPADDQVIIIFDCDMEASARDRTSHSISATLTYDGGHVSYR